ncbi:MAG: chromate efflux transporter [Novosphingobium sp.]|uniref:chromate efflux transporter n=1 Tax=Novosphingobium sp. TaxID=1874826 RepID=UPI0032B90F31
MTNDPTFDQLVRLSARIGCLSFGGPAGQIALMHREIVEERRWVSEEQYLHALNLCHLLPGPEAQQLAIWIGWKLHGLKGGLAAGLLFVIPGALVILALSVLYGFAAHLGWFSALFLGIKAAVLAVVVQALLRVAGRALNTRFKSVIAALAFAALFAFSAPFPLVLLVAAMLGMAATILRPDWLALKPVGMAHDLGGRPWRQSVSAIAGFGVLWAMPMALIAVTLPKGHVLWQIGVFFSKLAVVTFGGAYAVLAYMAQQAVENHHWLSAREMADGLGLAETTPGPLIMVTQFVGYLAAFREPEPFTPLVGGLIGALLTTWVTFVPCFLWIFTLAPWMERLERSPWLKGALAAITAAVVGVIANLSLWFALYVLFNAGQKVSLGPLHFEAPLLASLDWRATVLAIIAGLLIFGARWNIIRVLAIGAAGGLLLGMVP